MWRILGNLVLAILIIVEYTILILAIIFGSQFKCDLDCENCPVYPPCSEEEKKEIEERIREE